MPCRGGPSRAVPAFRRGPKGQRGRGPELRCEGAGVVPPGGGSHRGVWVPLARLPCPPSLSPFGPEGGEGGEGGEGRGGGGQRLRPCLVPPSCLPPRRVPMAIRTKDVFSRLSAAEEASPVWMALTRVYGVGKVKARKVCVIAGVRPETLVNVIPGRALAKLEQQLSAVMHSEALLRRVAHSHGTLMAQNIHRSRVIARRHVTHRLGKVRANALFLTV